MTNRQVALILAVARYWRAGYSAENFDRILRDAAKFNDWLEGGNG